MAVRVERLEPAEVKWHPGLVLGIESSCDETSVAILDEYKIRANIVTSQAELHRQYGGVVPEVASRAHVEAFLPALEAAFAQAGCTPKDITGIAVTNRPGLVGALSVGVSGAKAIHFAWNVPLIGVHHLEGHILSVLGDRTAAMPFPHACLIVSGGHTELLRVDAPFDYKLISETLDDAAGEAYDKGARLLGLGYPGGVRIQEAALAGDPKRYPLPIAIPKDAAHFSFSGLKTAVLRLTEQHGAELSIPDAAASLQAAVNIALTQKAMAAVDDLGLRALTLVGGVAANQDLRERLGRECERSGVEFVTPPIALCTDNAAMIAVAGSLRLAAGQRDGIWLEAMPSAPIPSAAT